MHGLCAWCSDRPRKLLYSISADKTALAEVNDLQHALSIQAAHAGAACRSFFLAESSAAQAELDSPLESLEGLFLAEALSKTLKRIEKR